MDANPTEILEKIVSQINLSIDEAENLMELIMNGSLNEAEIAAFLTALRMKEETEDEIAAFASIMRNKAIHFDSIPRPVIDIVGTGGDGTHTINVSTLSSLTIASMGHSVAKHGNYSASSKSGSADIMERLGYPLKESREAAQERIHSKNFAFLFAPMYHPAMKYVAPVRKNLKIRTVFNILGPLTNPAEAEIMLLGVYEKKLMKKMARALDYMKVQNFLVVHSEDGMDEISPLAKTHYILKSQGKLSEGVIDPLVFELGISSISDIQVKDPDHAFALANQIIDGTFTAGIESVALNASYALALIQMNQNSKDGASVYEIAMENFPIIFKHISEKNVREYIERAL